MIRLLTSLTISSVLFLGGCGQFNADKHKYDPYGIVEAENAGGQPDRLVQCSRDVDCPEYANALFWVAVDELSELSATEIDISGEELGLNKNMSVEEMAETLGPQLDELLGAADAPTYDLQNPEFKEAVSKLERAANAGSVYALNELGLLYMEIPAVQDFKTAELYFTKGMEKDDPNAVYNLARLAAITNPNSDRDILKYLKAAARLSPENFQNSYMFGLEHYGNMGEKRRAEDFFSKRPNGVTSGRAEFQTQFNLETKN